MYTASILTKDGQNEAQAHGEEGLPSPREEKKSLERCDFGIKMVSLKFWLKNITLVKKGLLPFVVPRPTCLLPSFVFSRPGWWASVAATVFSFMCGFFTHISRGGCDAFHLSITVINIEMTGTGCSRVSALIWKGTLEVLQTYLQVLYNDKFESNSENLFGL